MKNLMQENPIHSAIARNEISKLKKLIASGESIEKKGSLGDTPLILASKKGNLEAFKILIQAGANIDAVDNYKQSALYYAVTKFSIAPPINKNNDYSDMVAILIKNGAKTPSTRIDPDFFAKTLDTLNVRHEDMTTSFLKHEFHKEMFHTDPNYIHKHIKDFLEKPSSPKSLTDTLEKLINIDFRYENKVEAITHLAHLNSWTGEVVDLDHQIDSEGWLMHRYPPLKVKSLLKSLHDIAKDKVDTLKMFDQPKDEVIKKITSEITAQLTTYYTQVNQDTIKSIDNKDLKNKAIDEEVNLVCKKITELKPNKEFAIASGFPGHAIYIGFRKNTDNSVNRIVYNLGGGIKNNHVFSNTGRVYPDVIKNIPTSNFKDNKESGAQYIKGVIESKLGMHDNFLKLIYDSEKKLKGLRVTKEFTHPAQKRQLVGNCVLKNNNAAIRNRLQNDKLFKWLKHQEIKTATRVADIGDIEINAKENVKDLLSLNYVVNEYNRTKNLDAAIVNFNMFFEKRLNLTNTNHKDEKSKLNDFVKTNETNNTFKKWMKDANIKKMLDLALQNNKVKARQI